MSEVKQTATEAKEQAAGRLAQARRRWPILDHAIRMTSHYSKVNGNGQAGAVTFFAFLSFFPILALAFFTVGYVAKVYPDAQDSLITAIEQVLPGMVGEQQGQISLAEIQRAAGAVGLIGLLGVLYSGLGWLSGMRQALHTVFEVPAKAAPNFVLGKLRDLLTLAVIGLTLVVSVSISSLVTGFSGRILDWVGLGAELAPLLAVVTVVVGLLANMLLFFALFRLLADPVAPARALWSGALLGAIGFEILKWASSFLMQSTKNQPAFQAFGIALILVVWINYFSRVVMYAAAWAHTAPDTRALLAKQQAEADRVSLVKQTPSAHAGFSPRTAFAAGGATMLALVALLRRRK